MRVIVKLLTVICLDQQVHALQMSQQSHQQLTATSQNMISNLIGTELDLDAYEVEDAKPQNDDTDVQTDTEEEMSDDEEEEDEPEHEDNVQIKVTKKKDKSFGRDQNGMFNNHKNYMKLRNKINEQENSHSEMFETISKKLTDHNFIQSAIELSTEVETKTSGGGKTKFKTAPNSVSSSSEAGMSDADVKCYEAKYTDLDGKTGREHYLEYGQDEGRWPNCAQNLTNEMAQRYLDTNPDLQHEFGRSSAIARTLAREQYIDYGYKQTNRSLEVPDWDELWYCGSTNQWNEVDCECYGTLHYGYNESPIDQSPIEAFSRMRDFKTYSEASHGWTYCNDQTFGVQNNHNTMQCYCEPEKQVVPTTCADDGGDCICDGTVFYMKKLNPINSPYDYYDALAEGYTLNQVNGTGHIACTKSSFEDVNPLPGDDKVCMCDQTNIQMTVDQQWQIKEYWREQYEAVRIREQELALKEEARIEHERIIQEQDSKQEALDIKIAAQKVAMDKLKKEQGEAEAEAKKAKQDALKTAKAEREAAATKAKENKKKAMEILKAAEKKKEDARKAKADALKETHEEKKNQMLEAAEKAEKLAIEESTKAAQDQADAEHAEVVAALAKKHEEEAKINEAKAAADKLIRESEEEEAAKAAEVAQEQEDSARALAEDKAREEHAIALELKYEQQLEDSILHHQQLIQQKYAVELAIRKKKDDARLARESKKAEQQKKRDELAEKQRLAQEAEEAREQAEEDAIKAQLKKQEEEETDERRRLEKLEHDKILETAKAKDALIASQKAEQIAVSESQIADAQAAQKAAQNALAFAEENRQKVLDDKNRIKQNIENKKQKLIALAEKRKQTKALKLAAIETAKQWIKRALEAKKRAENAAVKAENDYKQYSAKMKATVEANKKAHADTVKNKQLKFLAQQDSMRAAHEAAEKARQQKEIALLAKHKNEMMLRRKEFEKRFKHVWTTGPAGISKFYVTSPNQQAGESLIANLFSQTIIADVKQQNVNIHREFMVDPEAPFGALKHRENQHRMSGVTNDDRVAELVEMVAAANIGSKTVPFDCIITPLINGSPDYIEWIKLQTMKKDPSLAHYNINPEEEMKGLNNRIGEIGVVEDAHAAQSTIVPNVSTVQVEQQGDIGEDSVESEVAIQDNDHEE